MIQILLSSYCVSRPSERIFRAIKLPFVPHKDMSIEYESDWAVSSIRYIYIMLDGSVEIGICGFSDSEINTLLETGNWSRNPS